MRPAQKPQESFRRFAPNNQYLESYEYDQCNWAKRSRLLAEVVERFREILQTRRHVCLRFGKIVHRKSRATHGDGKQHGSIGFEELRHALPLPGVSANPEMFFRLSRGKILFGVTP